MPVLRRKVVRFLAGALLLAAGVAACDGPADPSRDVAVTIEPSGVQPLSVGDTLTVRATVQNADNSAVRFRSSNAGVARVDETTGLVTALAVGEATITAASVEDPRASAGVQVRITDRPSSVVIDQIIIGGTLANYQGLRGVVSVQLFVEVGSAAKLQVLVDGVVACEQSYTAGRATALAGGVSASSAAASSVPTSCQFDTAEFDPASGKPRFMNVASTITARLLAADGTVRAQTSGISVRFANDNTIVTEIFAADSVRDAGQLRWYDGDLSVRVVPVLYQPSLSVVLTRVSYTTPAGRTLTAVATSAPFVVVFREDSLANVMDPDLRFSVATATSLGDPGPGLTSRSIRYDNQPPVAGTLVPRAWIGAGTAFSETYAPAAGGDRGGVGLVTPVFYVGDAFLADSAVVSRGRRVVNGAELQTAAGFGSYRAVALVCDGLENCAPAGSFLFGLDLGAPTVESLNLRDRAINPTPDLVITASDDLSGLPALPVEASVGLNDANAATGTCGPLVNGTDLPGRLVGSACVPDTMGMVIPVPRTTPGYYAYTLALLDRAGNRSVTVVRNVLVDHEPPTVTGVTVPVSLSPSEETTFSASATDNLDLTDIAFRLVYPARGGIAGVALPFDTVGASVGTAFDATLTTLAQRSSRFPLVRTLTTVLGTSRAMAEVDSVQVQAVDAAGSSSFASRALTITAPLPSDPFAGVTTVAPTDVAPRLVCTRACLNSDQVSAQVTLRVAGSASLTQPFARVYFFGRSVDTGLVRFFGSVGGLSAEGQVGGGQATFRYTLNYTPPAGLSGGFQLFAVGVTSGGNALRNEPLRVDFIAR